MDIVEQRNLAKSAYVQNLDSLRLPSDKLPGQAHKLKLYESMRRHEQELKSYLKAKITNLKEDCIQGSYRSQTKRILAIKAVVEQTDAEWSLKLFGKAQGTNEPFLSFFSKASFQFEQTDEYQPV